MLRRLLIAFKALISSLSAFIFPPKPRGVEPISLRCSVEFIAVWTRTSNLLCVTEQQVLKSAVRFYFELLLHFPLYRILFDRAGTIIIVGIPGREDDQPGAERVLQHQHTEFLPADDGYDISIDLRGGAFDMIQDISRRIRFTPYSDIMLNALGLYCFIALHFQQVSVEKLMSGEWVRVCPPGLECLADATTDDEAWA